MAQRQCKGCDRHPEPPGTGWRICAACVALLAELERVHGPDRLGEHAQAADRARLVAERGGRCGRCRRPALPGTSTCEVHAAQRRDYGRAYQQRVRAGGGRAKPPGVCGYKGCRHPATHGGYCGRHHQVRQIEARASTATKLFRSA